MSIKTSKSFTKEDEILTKGIVEIYKEILRGERRKFPSGTWMRPDSIKNATKCIDYLIKSKLKLTDKELKERLSANLFKENNLGGMLNTCFNDSPFDAINITYPRKFKPWEFKNVPLSYWNKNTGIEATKWLVEEKLRLSDEELKEQLSGDLFKENNLYGMILICFNNSPFDAINAVYPNKYKIYEFKRVPKDYWTKDTGIEAVRWLIEEKLKLSDNELKNELSYKLFVNNGLKGMLNICFNNSPFKAIDTAYPNKFKKSDFKNYKNKEE